MIKIVNAAAEGDDVDEDRKWKDRKESAEEVRKRLRRGWRYDVQVLSQYFQSCSNNWKVYAGPRTPQQVLKLQAIYKQALHGDNHDPQPDDLHSIEGQKWVAWNKFKGMDKDMAKRRFITFLSEIDPALIDVMPDERPPVGFPLDRKGNPICAKCNTVVGCSRPLLDQRKMNLRTQLFEHEELHEPSQLKTWIRNALQNQRCVWGMHNPISKAEAKPFMDWFNREENRGFFPYDSITLMDMVRDLVEHYHEVAFEMMQNKAEVDALQYNALAIKVGKLKEIYEQFSGDTYRFEVPCTRDNESCNMRRVSDGGRNHKHEVSIDPPTSSNVNSMEEAIALRTQCQKLGLSPSTGVVKSIEERCSIYRLRIEEHLEALRKATEAKLRNENRAAEHRKEKDQVLRMSRAMLERQCAEACNANQVEHVLTLVRRGCNPNAESLRGLTPALCLLLNEVDGERVEELLRLKADINRPNRAGLSPLMMACRLKDTRSVHVLMKNGAMATQKGMRSRTALHVCAVHHSEEIVRVIVDYLREGIGDSMRVVRFLDAVDDDGETALLLAASARNALMCYVLVGLGANPNTRNRHGRTAVHAARNNGWSEIADWLEKKMGAGAMKVETYSDLQFEKQARFGFLKIKELIQHFGKAYLLMVHGKVTLHALGCPFVAQRLVEDRGPSALLAQRALVDSHQRYVLKRAVEQYPSLYDLKGVPTEEEQEEKHQAVQELLRAVEDMYKLVKAGYTYPNTEAAAQPLPWTPLMCAVAVSDLRTARLLLREGADPNHPNKDGTTAVMLAAQLQDADLLLELIKSGGDVLQVDNQGFNAQAYAGSLPLPAFMDRDVVETVLDDDVKGTKYLSTTEIIKMSATMEVEELKDALIRNKAAADPARIERHALFLGLLGQYGLSTMSNTQNVLHHMKTVQWRLKQPMPTIEDKTNGATGEGGAGKSAAVEGTDEPLSEFEEEALRLYEEEEARARQAQADEARRLATEPPRCPICTLSIPCAHFFKAESLLKYLNKPLAAAGTDEGAPASTGSGKIYVVNKKIKVTNRIKELLEETSLADRHTDRSVALAKQYQQREELVEAGKEQRTRKAPAVCADDEVERDTKETIEDFGAPVSGYIEMPEERIPSSPALAIADAPVEQPADGAALDHEATVDALVVESDAPKALLAQDSLALVVVPVPILKPTTAPSTDLIPTSRKGRRRRVKFSIPGEAGEDEGGEDENEEDGEEAIEQQLLLTDATFFPFVDGEAAVTNEPYASDAPMVLTTLEDGKGETVQLASPAASREQVRSAIEVLQTGERDSAGAHRVSANAGPRRLMMFTKQPLYASAPSHDHLARRASRGSVKTHKVTVSGWLYIHLAALEAELVPLETISVTPSAWCALLHHVDACHQTLWQAPQMTFSSQVNGRSWQVEAPRCLLCQIFFVRRVDSVQHWKARPQEYFQQGRQAFERLASREKSASHGAGDGADLQLDGFLCWPCLIRREVFRKVFQAVPRVLRKSMPASWPIVSAQFVDSVVASLDEQCQSIEHKGMYVQNSSLFFDRNTVSRQGSEEAVARELAALNQNLGQRQRKDLRSPLTSTSLLLLDSLYTSRPQSRMEPIEEPPRSPGAHSVSVLSNGDFTATNDSATFSSFATTADASTKPKELQLLAYLLYKQHFEDAERTVRAILSRCSVNEGEGLFHTFRLLGLQADMYKDLGLFTLAQAVYLDLVDIVAMLMGMNSPVAHKAVKLVALNYYRVHRGDQADAYLDGAVEKMMVEMRSKTTKDEVVRAFKQTKRSVQLELLALNSIYVEHIMPLTAGRSALAQRFVQVLGLDAVYTVFSSQVPHVHALRRAFVVFMKDTHEMEAVAGFVDVCFRLRLVDDEDLRRLLVQHLLHKYLAADSPLLHFVGFSFADAADAPKKLTTKRDVKRHVKHNRHIDSAVITAIKLHLSHGTEFSIQLLDPLLLQCMRRLKPFYAHFAAHHSAEMVQGSEDIELLVAEAVDIAATMLQCHVRAFVAKRRVARKRQARLKGRR